LPIDVPDTCDVQTYDENDKGRHGIFKKEGQAWTFNTPDGRLQIIVAPGISLRVSGGSLDSPVGVTGDYGWGRRVISGQTEPTEVDNRLLKATSLLVMPFVGSSAMDKLVGPLVLSGKADEALDVVTKHFADGMVKLSGQFDEGGWSVQTAKVRRTETGYETTDGQFKVKLGRFKTARPSQTAGVTASAASTSQQ
jgi:hypothetical protein